MKQIRISKEQIDEIFETAENQFDACVKLYNLAYGDLSQYEAPIFPPKTSREVNNYIFDKFIEFDEKNHPDVYRGGLWLNRGFSSTKTIKGWVIIPKTLTKKVI